MFSETKFGPLPPSKILRSAPDICLVGGVAVFQQPGDFLSALLG